MDLVIDVGNSNVCIGAWNGEKWVGVWRFPTQTTDHPNWFYQTRLMDVLLEQGIDGKDLVTVSISSVVPELTPVFSSLIQHVFGITPTVVGPNIYDRIPVDIGQKYQIGTDLVCNAVAVNQLYQKDCIIVDFGTALTFTPVDVGGKILGVAITPGLRTAIQALFQKTAQLPPEVPLEVPESALGKDTTHAIQSGILLGYEGLIVHMIQKIKDEVGAHYQVVATGGLSKVITALEHHVDIYNPTLTLDGLVLIGRLMMGKDETGR